MTLFVDPPSVHPVELSEPDAFPNFDLGSVWLQIEIEFSFAEPAPPPVRKSLPPPSRDAKRARRTRQFRRALGAGIVVSGIAAVTFVAQAWLIWAALVVWGLLLMFGQISAEEVFKKAHREAVAQRDAAASKWRDRVGYHQFRELRVSLETARTGLLNIGAEEQHLLAEHKKSREQRLRKEHLERFRIGRAQIKGIGSHRTHLLASYGIETAADVNLHSVLQVPGFGPVNSKPLLEWRKAVERKFIYPAQSVALDRAEELRIRSQIQRKRNGFKRQLVQGPEMLRKLKSGIATRAAAPDPDLDRYDWLIAQAEADLACLR